MKKILVAPLDWGLGHATRCIPIIEELLKRNCEVFLAGSGDSLALLKKEFSTLKNFTLPGYRPVYPSAGRMVWKIASQVPKFLKAIKQEHEAVESIIDNHQIDLVISDNRYGCWSARIPSVIVTHQLNILMPKGFDWLSTFVLRLNKNLIGKFSECWIPDYENPNLRLSGKLSEHKTGDFGNVSFIGPLSRFKPLYNCEQRYDVVCVLSGPEPQRSIFEKLLKDQLKETNLRYFLVRGAISLSQEWAENEADFLNTEALQTVICQSSVVIARSGYSTIMDLAALKKRGILIPTPGQTEQEYLADRWADNRVFFTMRQRDFKLTTSLIESRAYPGMTAVPGHARDLLMAALDQFLNQHRNS